MLRLSLPALDINTPADRPTLPSLASLCLPDIHSRRPSMNAPATPSSDNKTSNANNDNPLSAPIPVDIIRVPFRSRVSSISSESSASSETSESSATSSSATTSTSSRGSLRVGSNQALKSVQRHHPYYQPSRHRVMLTDRFEDADIILALPLKPEVLAADEKRMRHFNSAKAQGLDLDRPQFLFGESSKLLRYENVRKEFPAALHPYRIIARYFPKPKPAQAPPAPRLTPPPTPEGAEPSNV